jgi:hypothetical protein
MEQQMVFESEFNIDEEYKPQPLCPNGTFTGNIVNVSFDAQKQCLIFKVTLAENEGVVMSDGNTPADGANLFARVYFPKPGDETEPTSSGRGNKRDAKISMMKSFADRLKIRMNSGPEVAEALKEGLWTGIPVFVKVSQRALPSGDIVNNVDTLVRDDSRSKLDIADIPTEQMPF